MDKPFIFLTEDKNLHFANRTRNDSNYICTNLKMGNLNFSVHLDEKCYTDCKKKFIKRFNNCF